MIVHIPPGTEYFPKYIGWYITTVHKYAVRAEETGDPRSMDSLTASSWDRPQKRDYHIWVWRPGIDFNQFGPVSP